jgi:hypothetical protein
MVPALASVSSGRPVARTPAAGHFRGCMGYGCMTMRAFALPRNTSEIDSLTEARSRVS